MTPPTTTEEFESPSLRSLGDGGSHAYELKFLLDVAIAEKVEHWARRCMTPDPHGDALLGGAYRTTTIYADTPELDVYHRSPSYARRKFRVRRYGTMPWVFLERKLRSELRVVKRRVVVPLDEVGALSDLDSNSDGAWAGEWFRQQLYVRRLQPAAQIQYLRHAFVGVCPEGPLRLTLDHDIRGVEVAGWKIGDCRGGLAVLPGRVVLELKFLGGLPLPFKQLVAECGLQPQGVSKYRLWHQAAGVPHLDDGASRA
ncbi:MAG: polyphosphate polymerase domain-containing protein [Phycisphaerales bacterium]